MNRKRKHEAIFTDFEKEEAENIRLVAECNLKQNEIENLKRRILACDKCSKLLPKEQAFYNIF